jgi:DNA polymerase III subunit epsilon
MFRNLTLIRPLAVIDVETTGVNTASDRVVQIATLRVEPDGRSDLRSALINPGVPIPAEATAIHGISDADVADEPPFDGVAPGLLSF